MNIDHYRSTRPLIGNTENATYRESTNHLYRHNCYIEALPPRWETAEVCKRLSLEPYYDEDERRKPALDRLECVNNISKCVFVMPDCIEIERRFSGMLRSGYCERNPLTAQYIRQIRSGFPSHDFSNGMPLTRTSSVGFGIIGPSGVGKSLMVESVLGLYPQVIVHEKYNGEIFLQKQLVWLKLDCPFDATLGGLCISFFDMVDTILGTNYAEKYHVRKSNSTITIMLQKMAMLAASLGIGALIIDEIQRLVCRKDIDPKGMLRFFEQLTNTFKVPVILVGTLKAFKLFSESFASSRRLAGQGDMIVKNFAKDMCWKRFLSKLWKYQYTNIPTPLTNNLMDVMFEECQGIADIAVKLYMLSQWRVIGAKDERITGNLIRTVANESLNAVKPILTALSRNDIEALKDVDDVRIENRDLTEYFRTCAKKVILSGTLNTLENQQNAATASKEDMLESPVGRIASLLICAGHRREFAIKCASTAAARFAHETDLKKATAEAFRLALEVEEHSEKIIEQEKALTPEVMREVKIKKPITSVNPSISGDLRQICAVAKKNRQPVFEALRKAGYIKPATEFMEAIYG
ncbi:MAG: ATP-binding protein [Geobacteraceae bacterium]|nr:ATP-binding protein [Geobacteraceae bacterium]